MRTLAVLGIVGFVIYLIWKYGSSSSGSDSSSGLDSLDSGLGFDFSSGAFMDTTISSKVKLPDSVSSLIDELAPKYGIDPNLAKAQAWAESGGNQSAVSKAGAIGVFQLEPATAAGLGVDPYSLSGNVEGGLKYLSQMLSRFNGNTTLALAAYNAGPGNVNKYGGIVPPFPETQSYVRKILAAVGLVPDQSVL